ncbi:MULTISPECIES: hypothetical protein [Streptomyces]|uniref:Integral membrane protein n=2 Tax=Streptomyces TaxID=1883 RepID=A0A100Y281_9ACTN|nr:MULTISPECIES: hypothetical protein [Streptomyces]KUH36309.1 hypothetical protein ATE80_24260 [Streptomyces kanasensis]UUS35125.1 hypothetical protein NRO40_30470 [Streptomyces changanensis]
MAGGLATAVEEAGQGHQHLARGAVIALAGGLALYHAAHACIALRFGRSPLKVAVWAAPGIGIPIVVVAGSGKLTPWQVVLILATEVVVHLLYARSAVRRWASGNSGTAPGAAGY